MSDTTHNKLYLKELIEALRWDINDLDEWSVYNDDSLNEEVDQLKKILLKVDYKFKNGEL